MSCALLSSQSPESHSETLEMLNFPVDKNLIRLTASSGSLAPRLLHMARKPEGNNKLMFPDLLGILSGGRSS